MDQLERAVAAGIITEAQRDAIAALPPEDGGLPLSLVNVLWAGGCALVVLAMVLVAAEVGKGGAGHVMWMCLAYAGGFLVLDAVLRGRGGFRLLSSLVLAGAGIALMSAGFAWQESVGGSVIARGWDYSFSDRAGAIWPYAPLLHGPYLPMAPVLAVGAILIRWRGFLPGWLMVWGALAPVLSDIYHGLRLEDVAPEWAVLFACAALLFGLGWWQDLVCRANHGFWQNKAGGIAFLWAMLEGFSLFGRPDAGYFGTLLALSLVLVLFSIYLRRPAGISVAAIGIAAYCAEWLEAWDNLFVAGGVLAVIGLGAIVLGVRAHLIAAQLDTLLPGTLRALRPAARTDPTTFGV
ncbi:MAG: hypothetical protein AAGF60_12885 [Pseudomonadota bacterium]